MLRGLSVVRTLAGSCENVHLRSHARTRSYVPTPRGTYIRSTLSWVPLHEGCHSRTFRFFMLRPIQYSPDVVSFLFFFLSLPPRCTFSFLCFVLTCSPSFRSFCRPLRCPFFYLSPILFFSPSFLFPSWSGHLLFLSSELKVRTYERNIPSTEIFYGFVNANIPTPLRPLVLPLLLQTLLSTSASCASDKKKCTRESHFTTYPNSSTKTSILYHHGTRFCPDGVYSFRDFSIR